MDDKETDERFIQVYQDPRFRTLRKKDKKVRIDQRFKSMFSEDKFTLKYSMDKRGRSRKHLIAEDYKKFYRMDDVHDSKEKKNEVEKTNENDNNQNTEADNDEKEDDNEKDDKKLTHKFGYHRGFNFKSDDEETNSESSSSSSESEDEDEEEEELEHNWGELDKDAPQIDHSTSRIAICNADWDRINTQDLYVLLNSFKRSTGTIHNVRIYYSKFGEERLRVEEEKGPSEFIFGKTQATTIMNDDDAEINSKTNDLDETDDEDEGIVDPNSIEKLRKYQLERLKYFYAVVECDSPETAEVIYNELDGLEYESSSTTFDIRFIPEDMTFDDVRLKEECTSMPSSIYKAPSFTNTALQQSNVKITWDENDPKRKEAFNKIFEENNEDDIKAYLASSSSDDEWQADEVEINEDMKESEKINKYKNLISLLEKENAKEDFDLQVTWEPKLKSNTKNLLNEQDSTKINLENESLSDHSISDGSKEDLNEEMVKKEPIENKKKYKRKNKKNEKNEVDNNDISDLELLMMDIENNDDKKKHFNYKNIIENFKRNNYKDDDDGFKFNPDDSRFSSMYNSHLYNIDQSDPNFKRTKAFEEILKKQKQKANLLIEHERSNQQINKKIMNTSGLNTKTLNTLVSKIKNKTNEHFGGNKRISNTNSRFNTRKKFRC